jgi:hypothetical protein
VIVIVLGIHHVYIILIIVAVMGGTHEAADALEPGTPYSARFTRLGSPGIADTGREAET